MWKKTSIFGPTKSFRLKQPYEYYKLQKKFLMISLPCTVAHLSTNMPENFLDASSNVFLPLRTLPDDLMICDRLCVSSIFCCSLGKIPKGNSEMGIILKRWTTKSQDHC